MTNTSTTFEPATSGQKDDVTGVGSVFVSNYPPYSFWRDDRVPDALEALSSAPPAADTTPLGLYLHIPFCRKRCKFCYFRVYTDKNSAAIRTYLDTLATEVELYSAMPRVAGRPLQFVYFGGGTPSYISAQDLRALVARLTAAIPWNQAREITFECEPGTLTRAKLEAIKAIGVTRISLGIENFNDEILKENGRAHLSEEILAVMPWVRELEFEQINVDLIAGMVGETQSTWYDTVAKTLDLAPDSLTVYQMELPFNTVYSREILSGEKRSAVADWSTKREWHDYAFAQFADAGYVTSSAYTMVKPDTPASFVYRDSLWQSCDLIGAGVASFSHVNGVHFQNHADWDGYISALEAGRLPLARAFSPDAAERLVREVILQLKLGKIRTDYFAQKFQVNVLERFAKPLQTLQENGMLTYDNEAITLSRAGLLRVDSLLPMFYDTKYQNARYT